MPGEHKKVLHAITACRTGELGTVLYACQSCGEIHAIGRSCGNRHCPTCQHDKTKAWLEKQTDRLLPCPYFLVTFTLPAELRALTRSHQRVIYAALFEASSEAPRALAANPKFVGTDRLGFFGVLHTWGRTLEYHPHVHYVVPGGGIDEAGSRWLPSRVDFLVPVEALSILFRAKFRDILVRENLLHLVDPAVWRRNWVVDSQAAGDGRASLPTSPRTSSEWQSVTTGSSPARMASSPSPTAASDPNDCGRCHWTRWNSSAASSSTSCPPGSRRYGTTDS